MLNKDVSMSDIDVAQWRNAQTLLLDSAKERRRIVVLHDTGRVRKVAHSDGVPVAEAPTTVADPTTTAKALYEANREAVDFVAVFERAAFDAYFAAVQDSWDIDEELDGFVQRTFALLDQYADTLVTYPEPARSTLGLQWRLGASRDEVIAAVQRFVEPDTTIVLGAFDEGGLWASLVLSFDHAGSVTRVTTADPSEVDLVGDMPDVAARVVTWVRAKTGTCSLGLFLERQAAERFLASADKESALREAAAGGSLLLSPVTSTLATALS
jgi:hypothetical protein